MNHIAAVLLLLVGSTVLVAQPVSAQEVTHPRIVYDAKWCRLMLPGQELAAARQRCVEFLSRTWAISFADAAGKGDLTQPGKRYALPSTLIETLVFNGAESMSVRDSRAYVEWSEVPPAVVNAPTPPAVVNAPTPPAVVNAPTPPAVVNAPTPPAVVNAPADQVPGSGVFVVGTDIAPGAYRTAGPEPGRTSCDYARLGGFAGDSRTIHVKARGPAVVSVLSSDAAFETLGCQLWVPVAS